MTKSYGNIKNKKLTDVLQDESFKKIWYISKDQIKVCQDCEFRHICTDCRAYLSDKEDIFSKPAKCGYNPYTNTWEEMPSNNPLYGK
jgi:SPASM domain peptide maturase of grasp-with-spasm system